MQSEHHELWKSKVLFATGETKTPFVKFTTLNVHPWVQNLKESTLILHSTAFDNMYLNISSKDML